MTSDDGAHAAVLARDGRLAAFVIDQDVATFERLAHVVDAAQIALEEQRAAMTRTAD